MSFKPTIEQLQAVDLSLNDNKESCKISAFAGTGKTSTLKLIADSRNDKGLYLAFNKAIANEAKNKFNNTNVTAKTFHSMAYTNSPRWLTQKLNNDRVFPSYLVKKFGINENGGYIRYDNTKENELKYGNNQIKYTANQLATAIINSVNLFCRSNDNEIKHKHTYYSLPKEWHRDDRSQMAYLILPMAKLFWDDITNERGKFKLEHDHYLKYWSLQNPIINSNYILFDEAQDADPIMLDILSKQDHSQIIYVGDRHQQIYGFRGAINAMASLDIPEISLTESFRFGNEIANIANNILLTQLYESKKLIGQNSINSSITNINKEKADAFISRTNAKAFETFIELSDDKIKRNPKLEFDTKKLINDITDANLLKSGKQNMIKYTSSFYGFQSWNSALEYAKEINNNDISAVVSLIEKYGADQLKSGLEKNQLNTQSETKKHDCVIMTAHKSKGLEFDNVILNDDFFYNIKDGELSISHDEARLLYVACTRAKLNLDISKLDKLFDYIV